MLSRSTRPVIFTDDFTSISSAWIPSPGADWTPQTDSGTGAYQGSCVGSDTSACPATTYRSADTNSNYTFTAKVKITATNPQVPSATAGIVVGADGVTQGLDKNEYYFGIYPVDRDVSGNPQSEWRLYKTTTTGGVTTWTFIAQGFQPFAINRYYVLGARLANNTITLFIDGALKYVFTDSSMLTSRDVGLRVRNATAVFDDVRLDGPGPGTPQTSYRYNDVTGALMQELNSSGSVTASYVSDQNGNIVAVSRGGVAYYYHYNAHGDVVLITKKDAQGNTVTVASYNYDAWGAPTELSAAGQQVSIGTWAGTPGQGLFLLFGGMFYDAATGLYLTKSREYNPKTGRFLQRDILDETGKNGVFKGFPFGKDAIGTNLYAWCHNNPVNLVDPSGRSPLGLLGAIVGAVVGGLIGLATGGIPGAIAGAEEGAGIGAAIGDYIWTACSGGSAEEAAAAARVAYARAKAEAATILYNSALASMAQRSTADAEAMGRIEQSNVAQTSLQAVARQRVIPEQDFLSKQYLEGATQGAADASLDLLGINSEGASDPMDINYGEACGAWRAEGIRDHAPIIVGVPRFSPLESASDFYPLPEYCKRHGVDLPVGP